MRLFKSTSSPDVVVWVALVARPPTVPRPKFSVFLLDFLRGFDMCAALDAQATEPDEQVHENGQQHNEFAIIGGHG